MRTIKFRAWDKEARIMHQPVSLLSNWDNEKGSYKMETTQFIYMQSTGLFDKNRNPIYEGDIMETESITIRDILDPYPHRRIIAWNDEEARLDFHWITGEKQTSGHTFCKKNLENCWEIIGNMFLNPELLDNK